MSVFVKRLLPKLKVLLIVGVFFSIGLVLGLKWQVDTVARPSLRTLSTVRPAQAAIVFGAFVYPNGTPCLVLQDRLEMGLQLYRKGIVEKLLLTGDHGRANYDEVNAMRVYLENRGIPREALYCDHAGFDTYDSLYRARHIFEAKSLVLVTQSFHLNRALYIAKALDIRCEGVASDQRAIPEIRSLKTRELLANFKALQDVLTERESKYLGPPVPLSGSSSDSHDFI